MRKIWQSQGIRRALAFVIVIMSMGLLPDRPTHRVDRYGGVYVPKEAEAVDPKESIEAKCAPGCAAVWQIYKKCEARIEEKVCSVCTHS